MGKSRFVCEYCNKSFEDSHEARQRHNRGRNHKANVKLWYDSFADHERRAVNATSGISAGTPQTTRPDSTLLVPIQPFAAALYHEPPAVTQDLPPSMHPAPPGAFYYCRSDWG
uniref:Matrin-type domain-containing protein n=1 Tax=Peronospora matthiolae TaxID=2874970 RepID=A0AAV1TZG7_9STRA